MFRSSRRRWTVPSWRCLTSPGIPRCRPRPSAPARAAPHPWSAARQVTASAFPCRTISRRQRPPRRRRAHGGPRGSLRATRRAALPKNGCADRFFRCSERRPQARSLSPLLARRQPLPGRGLVREATPPPRHRGPSEPAPHAVA